MNIEEYLTYIDELTEKCIESRNSFDPNKIYFTQSLIDELINKKDHDFYECLDFCYKNDLCPKDIDRYSFITETGIFGDLSNERKISVCYLDNLIMSKVMIINLKDSCQNMSLDDELFTTHPEAIETIRKKSNGGYDLELVDMSKYRQYCETEIVEFKGSYLYVDYGINPKILPWLQSTVPDSKLFIRIQSKKVFDTPPPILSLEECLVPANPNWIKKLEIYNRGFTGASYYIPDTIDTSEMDKYYDFHVKGIEKLEVVFKRNGSGNLSGMIEELNHREINHEYLVGFCVHFDTDAAFGCDYNNAVLNHLDLALNYYIGKDAIENRRSCSLASGEKVTDASTRRHLIRLEQIPFKMIFPITHEFFEGKVLFKEWLLQLLKIKT